MRHKALPAGLFLVASLLAATLPASTAQGPTIAFEAAALKTARSIPAEGRLRIAAVPLSAEGKDQLRDLELQRFEVFAPGARIVVHTDLGEQLLPRPANVYLRGQIAGDPRSRAVISVLETGEIRGLVTTTGRYWLVGAAPGESLETREFTQLDLIQDGGSFQCDLDGPGATAMKSSDEANTDALAALLSPGLLARQPEGIFDHTAVIAIETDNEFLNLGAIGGNTTTATNYIADLVAFASTIYTAEIQTSWSLGHVSLWQTTDPYAQTSGCGLLEFGRQWNISNTGIQRTVAHFLSGKNSNSGIAWVGVLCRAPFTTSPANLGITCAAPVSGSGSYGGDYGFTGGIDANFNINSPAVVWDIVAFTHEIGHNFNSPHTHCYAGLEGNAEPIDKCYGSEGGCWIGATSLPSGCPGPGMGCGTIMSYCHLLPPGMSNLTLTLGLGHPYGIHPERVPTRMRNHVVSVASGNPSCLAPISNTVIFEDGFESGNTANWI